MIIAFCFLYVLVGVILMICYNQDDYCHYSMTPLRFFAIAILWLPWLILNYVMYFIHKFEKK